MKSARPVVVPDLFVRTYIGDRDRYWVAVRRRHGRRVVLDLVDRLNAPLLMRNYEGFMKSSGAGWARKDQ